MPNMEIKARCHDLKKVLGIVHGIKTDYLGSLHQVDTYYETKEGRLKLREIDGVEAQLIPYYKKYSKNPMKSSYSVLHVKDKVNLKDILEKILGQVIVVDKQREVFLVGNVRVHLDVVKGLGSFIELEAVYAEDSALNRKREINKLMDIFQIEKAHLLDKFYIDYFLDKGTSVLFGSLRVLFHFSGESHSILEIENLDIDKSEPLERRYFWLLFEQKEQKLDHLKFVSMGSDDEYQHRRLGNINLKFNLESAEVEGSGLSLSLHRTHSMFIGDGLGKALAGFFAIGKGEALSIQSAGS